ncbi:FAD:protein FMN transferase [Marivita sp. S2033]|uniref:FAD:protein FMN transferase n=1 Tax=Marivita sp. S2033 TaxID=3373187 RepID=UPI003981E299
MRHSTTRRRFLTILASSAACAALPAQAREQHSWTGRAMGAEARLTISGAMSARDARAVFRAVEHELARLERVFSLYRSESQIVQLNDTGVLKFPAPELLDVLSLCGVLNDASGGAFDPTVQPLWLGHAKATTQNRALSASEEAALRDAIGWKSLRFDASEVRFERSGGALTLNGVAQGYVSDRIAALLRARGLSDVLVDMGEISAGGQTGWPVGIATPQGAIVERITLSDRGLATSAPMGTLLAPERGLGHILDPRKTGDALHSLVSVSAPSAALADGLSTAFCLMPKPAITTALARFPDARVEALT